MDSVLSEYQASLAELTFNSKPHINMLTVLAEENVHYASDIVKIIEKQLSQVRFKCFILDVCKMCLLHTYSFNSFTKWLVNNSVISQLCAMPFFRKHGTYFLLYIFFNRRKWTKSCQFFIWLIPLWRTLASSIKSCSVNPW